MFHFFPIQEAECIYWQGLAGLCTKNTSWALIERPYSCAPQAVGAVYDRPGFFVQSPIEASPYRARASRHPVCAASVASRLFFMAHPLLLCEEGNGIPAGTGR